MSEVYLMPIGSKKYLEHMNDTLINNVSKTLVASYLDKEKEEFDSIIKMNEVPVWGLEPRIANLRTWNNFKFGNIVIFIPSKDAILIT